MHICVPAAASLPAAELTNGRSSKGGEAMMAENRFAEQSPRILRLAQVIDLTGLGRSMIYQMEADRRFPKRVKIGTRAVGWIEEEVKAWLIRRIEARPA